MKIDVSYRQWTFTLIYTSKTITVFQWQCQKIYFYDPISQAISFLLVHFYYGNRLFLSEIHPNGLFSYLKRKDKNFIDYYNTLQKLISSYFSNMNWEKISISFMLPMLLMRWFLIVTHEMSSKIFGFYILNNSNIRLSQKKVFIKLTMLIVQLYAKTTKPTL